MDLECQKVSRETETIKEQLLKAVEMWERGVKERLSRYSDNATAKWMQKAKILRSKQMRANKCLVYANFPGSDVNGDEQPDISAFLESMLGHTALPDSATEVKLSMTMERCNKLVKAIADSGTISQQTKEGAGISAINNYKEYHDTITTLQSKTKIPRLPSSPERAGAVQTPSTSHNYSPAGSYVFQPSPQLNNNNRCTSPTESEVTTAMNFGGTDSDYSSGIQHSCHNIPSASGRVATDDKLCIRDEEIVLEELAMCMEDFNVNNFTQPPQRQCASDVACPKLEKICDLPPTPHAPLKPLRRMSITSTKRKFPKRIGEKFSGPKKKNFTGKKMKRGLAVTGICSVCDGRDTGLLTCHKCHNNYHFHCHIPQLDSWPTGSEVDDWYCSLCNNARTPQLSCGSEVEKQVECERVLLTLLMEPSSYPFRKPINKKDVPDYYSIIKRPMDLDTIRRQLKRNSDMASIHFYGERKFLADCSLVMVNCILCNKPDSEVGKCGLRLRELFFETVANKEVALEVYKEIASELSEPKNK